MADIGANTANQRLVIRVELHDMLARCDCSLRLDRHEHLRAETDRRTIVVSGASDVRRGSGPREWAQGAPKRDWGSAKMIDDEDGDVVCRWPVPEERVEE